MPARRSGGIEDSPQCSRPALFLSCSRPSCPFPGWASGWGQVDHRVLAALALGGVTDRRSPWPARSECWVVPARSGWRRATRREGVAPWPGPNGSSRSPAQQAHRQPRRGEETPGARNCLKLWHSGKTFRRQSLVFHTDPDRPRCVHSSPLWTQKCWLFGRSLLRRRLQPDRT
jgi:hypothetical protein